MPIETKTAMLQDLGVDCVIRKHFDHAFASIPAEEFLSYLKGALPPLSQSMLAKTFALAKSVRETWRLWLNPGALWTLACSALNVLNITANRLAARVFVKNSKRADRGR